MSWVTYAPDNENVYEVKFMKKSSKVKMPLSL